MPERRGQLGDGSGTITGEHTPPSGQRRPESEGVRGPAVTPVDPFTPVTPKTPLPTLSRMAPPPGLPPLMPPPPALPPLPSPATAAGAQPAGSAGGYALPGSVASWPLSTWRPLAVRVCATIAVLTTVGTYVAAQIDFLRRHEPGIAPEVYWAPQLWQVWTPGLAVALGFALVAVVLHKPPKADPPGRPD